MRQSAFRRKVPQETMNSDRSHVNHPLKPYEPLIVNVALTGGVLDRARAPRLPLSVAEIVDDAERCFNAGATIAHVHVRDRNGDPDWRRRPYAEAILELRERCPGIVVCATTSGRSGLSREQRADVLTLEGPERPDMASLTLGSLNFHTGASVNDVATIEYLAAAMRDAGIKPELEIFDMGMTAMARRLIDRQLLPPENYANIILGSLNTAPAEARALALLVDMLPAGTVWAAAGLGAYQLPANGLAVFMGGHVRTGLEDNPDLDHAGREPAGNLDLVERAAGLARAAGREISTPAQTRERLGLHSGSESPVATGRVSRPNRLPATA